ncbi:unnamed protein product [Gordionus sp. m RMFG-2023]
MIRTTLPLDEDTYTTEERCLDLKKKIRSAYGMVRKRGVAKESAGWFLAGKLRPMISLKNRLRRSAAEGGKQKDWVAYRKLDKEIKKVNAKKEIGFRNSPPLSTEC